MKNIMVYKGYTARIEYDPAEYGCLPETNKGSIFDVVADRVTVRAFSTASHVRGGKTHLHQ